MRKSAILFAIGKLMQVLGGVLLVPLGIAVWDYRAHEVARIAAAPEVIGFVCSILISLILGTILVVLFRRGRELQGAREGYAIVALGWIWMTFLSCLPLFFYLTDVNGMSFDHVIAGFTDAYFEIMSGFTTTGATILTDIEAVPRSLLFLRSLAHWLGGMGIITLAIVIFPSMGVTAYQMFRGEVPGARPDKLRPRLSQTVSILWGVYGLFTAVETVLLWAGGMTLFEAVCHAFATMATGGFSTMNNSIAAYGSDFIHWVIIFFMYLAGVNFLLHFRALRGDFETMYRNREFVFYNGVIAVGIILVTSVLYFHGLAPKEIAVDHFRHDRMSALEFDDHYANQEAEIDGLYSCIRTAAFQVVAIVTTTGFATADFDMWPDLVRFLLVFFMFFGGCLGSTGGGMKMLRIMIVFKVAWNQLRKMTQPRLVAPVKVGDQVIDDDRVVNIVAFFILFTGLFIMTGFLMTFFVPDLTTAVACSIATIGNIGPGLAGIGATENYAWIPLPGKWILVISMLLGRLEIFTVLIMFRPSVWRK
ncbi:MAG: TrkH family potassium uptake protein [Candidatus Zixiibacteriota bacterium]|nr:MAG: TrkH family potassium uptake protein [candidate division Zixibacteria bacterium]